MKENRKYISDKKQITYILTQNGNAILVHLKFRVYQNPRNTSFMHASHASAMKPGMTLIISNLGGKISKKGQNWSVQLLKNNRLDNI